MSVTKRIPIAIGIKPNAVTTFTNKTIDGSQNTLQNIPTSALQFNTISINGSTVPLGGSISLQVEGGDPIVDTNTTYSIKASIATGGAKLDLDAGGSGVGTDSINFIGAGNVTITRVDENTIQIGDAGSLGGVALTADNTAILTNKSISGSSNTLTNIPTSALSPPFININGSDSYLGQSVIVAGGGGGGDVTANSETIFTNKTINGQSNILSNIQSSALSTPFISINGTQVNLGSNFNVSGLGDVTLTGAQDLTNKSLLSPIISTPTIIGTIRAGDGNGSIGNSGQVLKSAGSGNVYWGNESRTTASTLEIGSGLIGAGGSSFDGSNQITLSINTGVVATLTGSQTLTNKTISDPVIEVSNEILSLPPGPDTLIGRNSTDTLTNKTLTAPNLTGDLKVNGVSGSTGQTIVSDGSGGLTWGAGGGGGSGTINGPLNSSDNAIVRWDGSTGTIIQNSSVTISDDGAISAQSTGNIIPFYFENQTSFPNATEFHGAIAHSHSDGAMYFAHAGSWNRLANSTEVQVSSRQNFSTTT